MHYRPKDVTGLLLDSTYHVNCIQKGSARTPLGIADKFDTYEKALKSTLLNKFAIETLNNKLQEVTLKMVLNNLIIFLVLLWTVCQYMAKRSIKAKYRETVEVNYRQQDDITNIPPTCTPIGCNEYRMSYDRQIDTSRCK